MAGRDDRKRTLDRLYRATSAENLRARAKKIDRLLDLQLLRSAEASFVSSLGGDPTVSARWADVVAAIGVHVGDGDSALRVQRTRGVQAHVEGRHAEAVRRLRRAREHAVRGSDRLAAADIDRVLIDVHLAQGDTAAGNRAYRRAARLYEKLGDVSESRWGSLEMNRGNLHHARDDYRGALAAYDLAAERFSADGGAKLRLGNVGFNRGNILALQDRFDDAREAYREARIAFRRAGRSGSAAKADRALAELDRLEGRLDDSLQRLDLLRVTREQQGDSIGLAHVDLERGRVLNALNRFAEARQAADRAHRGFDAAGQPLRLADCDALLGELDCGRGHVKKGVGRLRSASKTYRSKRNRLAAARVDSIRAAALLRSGKSKRVRQEAGRLARRALRTFDAEKIQSGMARAGALAALAAEGPKPKATVRARAREALKRSRRVGDARTEFEMSMLLGREEERRNDPGKAYRRFVAAERCVERLRSGVHTEASKLAFAEDKGEVYEKLISNRLRKGGSAALRQALTYSERGKARALIDALGQLSRAQSARRGGAAAQAMRRLRKLERELHRAEQRLEQAKGPKGFRARLPSNLRRLNAERLRTLDRLRQVDAERAMLHGAGPPEPWSFLDRLGPDEVVLSYSRTGGRFHLFLVDAGGIEAHAELASVDEVQKRIDRLRFQFGKGIYGDDHFRQFGELYESVVREHLRALQPMLLGPVWERIAGRQVWTVPHESLHGLPFHALERDGRTAIEHCEISYAPSVATLAALSGRRGSRNAAPPVILGVADRAAPEIDREVSMVERRLAGARKLQGRDATVQAIRELKRPPSILHVACHASFQQSDPWSAGLRLGDAWVRLADLYDMRRTGDVVVLSGCATGIGTVYSGDEWVGLVRGFLRAGARTVLASLWEVHDRSTVRLMEAFYEAFASGRSVAGALAEAQRQARRAGVPVLHWAAFMAIGSSRPRLQRKEVA